MKTMNAIGFRQYKPAHDPQALEHFTTAQPVASGRDLLVKVEAISVNPVDTKVRRGTKKQVLEQPRIIGWDVAGIVDSTGAEVKLFKPGDAVYFAGDITRAGGNAEYVLVDERIVGRKPATLDFAQAASLPLTTITAYEALFDRLLLDVRGADRNATLLIIGGAGGVGSIGIQLAKLAGLKVIATASRPETTAWVNELGADHVVDHRKALRPQLEALGLKDVDYVANFSSTDEYWEQITDVVRPGGRFVTIVENAGPLAQERLKTKSLTHAWEMMFTRPMFKTPDMIRQHELLNQVADWIDAGRIRHAMKTSLTPISADNLRKAHAQLESGTSIGTVVLHGWMCVPSVKDKSCPLSAPAASTPIYMYPLFPLGHESWICN
jgi:zinc-binding alcohol dehydrogenase family protein